MVDVWFSGAQTQIGIRQLQSPGLPPPPTAGHWASLKLFGISVPPALTSEVCSAPHGGTSAHGPRWHMLVWSASLGADFPVDIDLQANSQAVPKCMLSGFLD